MMEPWLLNWTAFVVRNTHAEIEGVSYEDGPEWFEKMFDSWKKNSDYGKAFAAKTDKSKIIEIIESRVIEEHKKHSKSIDDWAKIAAHKIYSSLNNLEPTN